MKKRFLRLLFLTGTVLTLLTACEYDFIEPTPPAPPPSNEGDTLSYAADIQPFFTASCASCHPSVFKPDLTAANSYNALVSGGYVKNDSLPETSSLYIKCKTGTMAPYTTKEELDLLYNWIYFGAKNN